MGGSVVFAGQLLTRLRFPLDFDYLHATRYDGTTRGGTLSWKVLPQQPVTGRVVLVLDDILDEGTTMAAIRERLLADGAQDVLCAVFADKALTRWPIAPDFVGLSVPDRYVFSQRMDRGCMAQLASDLRTEGFLKCSLSSEAPASRSSPPRGHPSPGGAHPVGRAFRGAHLRPHRRAGGAVPGAARLRPHHSAAHGELPREHLGPARAGCDTRGVGGERGRHPR
jgi:hypothetical protein